MRRSGYLAAATALTLLLGVGCTKTSDTSTGPAATSAPASTTTSVATISKDKLIEEADKLCKADDDKPGPKSGASADDIEKYLKDGVANARETSKKIQALGTPDKDADKLKTALDKYNAFLDLLEKDAKDLAKDPNMMDTDADLKKAKNDATAAAKDFGFKVCGGTSSSSSGDDTTTTAKSSKSTTTTGSSSSAGNQLAKSFEGANLTDEQIACLGQKAVDDPTLLDTGKNIKGASMADQKAFYKAFVDCAGPAFLVDAFMTGIAQADNPPTAAQQTCIRTAVEALSVDDFLDILVDSQKAASFLVGLKSTCA